METAGPSGKFEFNASLTAPGQLTIKRTLSVEGSRFPAAQWPTLRAFYLKAAEAERHALIIEPAASDPRPRRAEEKPPPARGSAAVSYPGRNPLRRSCAGS